MIIDFMNCGGIDRFWYVLQYLISNLSRTLSLCSLSHAAFTIDDYEQVLRGCIESLPAKLDATDYEASQNDIFLVFKYLADCSKLSTSRSLSPMQPKRSVSA